MTAEQCRALNNVLFRRTPDWDKELTRDRFPFNYLYTSMYDSKPWKSFTGDTHTWDRVHVTRPDDDGCWDQVSIGDGSATSCSVVCQPGRFYTGWGSTRASYGKYHRDYQSPVFCFDQLRDVEQAPEQIAAIVEGHKELPDEIISDFMRLFSVRSADKIYICGKDNTTVDVTAGMFTNNCRRINLGGTGNLPTSKLSMQYLNNHVEELTFRGYHKKAWFPPGKFAVTSDFTTNRLLSNANPALAGMYQAADFAKGGKFFAYGVTGGCGDWMFKVDPTPMRFQHVGSGILERVWPYQNVATTVGKRPLFDTAYKYAAYQLYHVYNRDARQMFSGETPSIGSGLKFDVRNLMGKWSWKNPDYFKAVDPNSGKTCEYFNDKHNQGYFLGEYEIGVKTEYPEIEMCIIALRQPEIIVDDAYCGSQPSMVYQTLTPYNTLCNEGEA